MVGSSVAKRKRDPQGRAGHTRHNGSDETGSQRVLTGAALSCQLAATARSIFVTVAPEIAVSRWFNSSEPLSLAGLRGRPVLLHAFQMLCPGCVAHGTPQTQRAFDVFKNSDLQVIGLHTVFEHHAAMTPVSLEAFIHEYRLTFPIGVDEAAEENPIPVTMQRFGMQGTPTSILIGRDGTIRHHGFGQQSDMVLGAIIATELGR
jgi:peroxiredoxin